MPIARSSVALIGTDESTGVSIANNANTVGTVQDLLADTASACRVILYFIYTSTVAVGTLDIYLAQDRLSSTDYTPASPQFQITPSNATVKMRLGAIEPGRFLGAKIVNNATGASATVALIAEVEK